jgi:hypothetical protein
MKTMIFKNGIFAMLMLAFALVTLPSCDKEEETPDPPFQESLVGTWDITSYLLDGDEWMGLIITAGSLTFEAPAGNSGIFSQEVTFADGESAVLSGRYILDTVEGRVIMYYEGEPIIADIVIAGDKMIWEGTQQEFPLVLKATKRL